MKARYFLLEASWLGSLGFPSELVSELYRSYGILDTALPERLNNNLRISDLERGVIVALSSDGNFYAVGKMPERRIQKPGQSYRGRLYPMARLYSYVDGELSVIQSEIAAEVLRKIPKSSYFLIPFETNYYPYRDHPDTLTKRSRVNTPEFELDERGYTAKLEKIYGPLFRKEMKKLASIIYKRLRKIPRDKQIVALRIAHTLDDNSKKTLDTYENFAKLYSSDLVDNLLSGEAFFEKDPLAFLKWVKFLRKEYIEKPREEVVSLLMPEGLNLFALSSNPDQLKYFRDRNNLL